MDVIAVILSFLGPPAAGGYLLRRAGCGWWRVIFGAAMCFAIAFAVFMLLFAVCDEKGWDMDTALLFLPFLELAVFAYLVTNDWKQRST